MSKYDLKWLTFRDVYYVLYTVDRHCDKLDDFESRFTKETCFRIAYYHTNIISADEVCLLFTVCTFSVCIKNLDK